ncbi:MAG: MBL fold metallo-hydrolase [Myxococcota bacterium]
MSSKLVWGLVALAIIGSVAIWQRHRIIVPLATTGAPVPHVEDAPPVPGGRVFGDDAHFTIVALDEQTFAIAEPRSWARNVNYLILGSERALLFDAGVGHYDIRPVVASLTDLPLTFMPSHFHYDHTGQGAWPSLAVVDLPHLRERAEGNRLPLSWGEHLGPSEAIDVPVWEVTEWIAPNATIDLGGRELVLLYTPGHTDNSVSLFDVERQLMFTGDFLTSSGSLSSFLPTSNLGDYLQSADKVLARTEALQRMVFRGAHASPANEIPNESRETLTSLRDGLRAIRAGEIEGEGAYPVVYRIREDMTLTTEPAWLQDWTPSYPNGHAVH